MSELTNQRLLNSNKVFLLKNKKKSTKVQKVHGALTLRGSDFDS
jgi:hypothetical protein